MMKSLKRNSEGKSPISVAKDYYPTLYLNSGELEGKYDIGDRLKLTINARIASVSKRLGESTGYSLDLIEMEVEKKKSE